MKTIITILITVFTIVTFLLIRAANSLHARLTLIESDPWAMSRQDQEQFNGQYLRNLTEVRQLRETVGLLEKALIKSSGQTIGNGLVMGVGPRTLIFQEPQNLPLGWEVQEIGGNWRQWTIMDSNSPTEFLVVERLESFGPKQFISGHDKVVQVTQILEDGSVIIDQRASNSYNQIWFKTNSTNWHIFLDGKGAIKEK